MVLTLLTCWCRRVLGFCLSRGPVSSAGFFHEWLLIGVLLARQSPFVDFTDIRGLHHPVRSPCKRVYSPAETPSGFQASIAEPGAAFFSIFHSLRPGIKRDSHPQTARWDVALQHGGQVRETWLQIKTTPHQTSRPEQCRGVRSKSLMVPISVLVDIGVAY